MLLSPILWVELSTLIVYWVDNKLRGFRNNDIRFLTVYIETFIFYSSLSP